MIWHKAWPNKYLPIAKVQNIVPYGILKHHPQPFAPPPYTRKVQPQTPEIQYISIKNLTNRVMAQ